MEYLEWIPFITECLAITQTGVGSYKLKPQVESKSTGGVKFKLIHSMGSFWLLLTPF